MSSKCALIAGRVALEDPGHRLSRLKEIRGRLVLHEASLESYACIHRVVHEGQPDECDHLAAQSFVSYSFDTPAKHGGRWAGPTGSISPTWSGRWWTRIAGHWASNEGGA